MIVPGWAQNKEHIMLAVFATLTFLIAVWLCTTIVAGMLEHSGHKILAAMNGRSPLASVPVPPVWLRVSQRYPSLQRPMRAQAGLRAAA